MYDKDKFIDQNINITIPVIINYQVLTRYIGGKLVGEILSTENKDGKKSNYAMVLDLSIKKSDLDGFDLLVNVTLKTLTSFFRNKEVNILFYAALELDRDSQHVSLKDFIIDGKTKIGLADKLLETIVNKWVYKKLKKKMFFDLMPLIEEKVTSINIDLENKLEAKEGVNLLGSLDRVEISKITAGETELWISVSIRGTGLLELEKLDL